MSSSVPPIDMNVVLAGNLAAIIQQGVADNQRLAQHTLLAYQKDMFQGGQGDTGMIMAAMNSADRTPVIKVVSTPAGTVATKTSKMSTVSSDPTNTNNGVGVDPSQLANWMMANIFQQKYASEAAYINQTIPGANIPPMIPFGSTTINVNAPNSNPATTPTTTDPVVNAVASPVVPNEPIVSVTKANPPTTSSVSPQIGVPTNSGTSTASKLGQGLIAAAALIGGGLGLTSFLNSGNNTTSPVTQPVVTTNPNGPDLTPRLIEGTLEWEFDSEKGLNLKENDSNKSNGAISPSSNTNTPESSDSIARNLNR